MRPSRPSLLGAALHLLVAVGLIQAELSPLEEKFVGVPSADLARENLRFITSQEHMAGTVGDLTMAKVRWWWSYYY